MISSYILNFIELIHVLETPFNYFFFLELLNGFFVFTYLEIFHYFLDLFHFFFFFVFSRFFVLPLWLFLSFGTQEKDLDVVFD